MVAALLVSWPFWRPGRFVVGFDNAAYSAPNLRFTLDEWGARRLPLWNDLIFGGVSHLGNTQAGALYPFRLLAAPFSVDRGMNLLIAAHLVLLMLGMRWVVRRLGLVAPAGFVAAAIAGASGATVVKTLQFEQFLVLAWAPILLVAVHTVVTSDRPWRATAGFAAAATAAVLAGHPQITYLLGWLTVAWALGLLLVTRRWGRILHLGVGGVLAGCSGALQLVATLHATSVSAIDQGRALRDLVLPARAVLPDHLLQVLFGTVRDIDPAAFAGGFESTAFLGVVACLLAAAGLVAAWRHPTLRPLGVVLGLTALVATVLSLGSRTVIYRGAWHLVPGFDLPRVPARWLDVTMLAVALLAAFGIDAVRRAAAGRRELAALAAAITVVLLVAVTGLATVSAGRRTAAFWVAAAVIVAAAAAVGVRRPSRSKVVTAGLVAVLVVELATGWSRGGDFRTTYSASVETYAQPTDLKLQGEAGFTVAYTDDGFESARNLVSGLRPNANVLEGIRSLDGYDGGVQVTKRWLSLILRGHEGPMFELPLRNQLDLPLDPDAMARMNVRWVLLDLTRDWQGHVPAWDGPILTDDHYAIWENPAWRSEATLWFATQQQPDADTIARTLRGAGRTLDATALVEPGAPAFTCSTACDPAAIELDRVNARELRATTDAALPGVLSVGGQYDDGWQVTVDGRSSPAIPVDGFFLGVAVPAGAHQIRFVYRPDWVVPSGVLMVLGLLGIAGLLVLERRYHRRDAGRDAVHHG